MSTQRFPKTPLILARLLPAFIAALLFAVEASGQTQTDIPGPAGSEEFGTEIYALPSGNIVVTDPSYSIPNGPKNVGAVYLYSGATGKLVSKLTGSTEADFIAHPESGSTSGFSVVPGIVVLSNGNFIVRSLSWHNAAGQRVGAATFINGTTGLSGVVSASNSLVGSTTSDLIGFGFQGIRELSNGNYVVSKPGWDNGAAKDAGAVTFGSGTSGISGVTSPSNSLVGSSANDQVGAVVALTNGNYVVTSPLWDNGAEGNAGAVTFGNGTAGTKGVVSPANSLVGATTNSPVGGGGTTALSNGNYVVSSPTWGRELTTDPLGNQQLSAGKGAVTFANGTTGITGEVSASNSLVGSGPNDRVGSEKTTALPNGSYVVRSSFWSGQATGFNRGAVTFGHGTTGIKGVVSESNSLVGSKDRDRVGEDGVTVLSNGNYVVLSSRWDNGGNTQGKGAATFGNGTTGRAGVVSASNSLVGATTSDRVGGRDEAGGGVTALPNGSYIVSSPLWNNGAAHDAGAATFGNGTSGVSGVVSPSNSLVGSKEGDLVGSYTTALTSGNYVIGSPDWDNGAMVDAGASTFGNGTSGISGPVSSSNSLVGSTAGDAIGGTFASFVGGGLVSLITELASGNYIISTPLWDNGGIANAGAVTFVNGTNGITGKISAANSLVGSTANDQVGFDRNSGNGNVAPTVKTLPNGDYAIGSPNYDNGTIVNAGALTYGNGANGTVGTITAANSYLGTTANGRIGGNYVFDAVNSKFVIGRVSENLVTFFQPPRGSLLNISTRMQVGTDPNQLIGGFIITGTAPKKVIILATGPSLAAFGIPGVLANPVLELFKGNTSIAKNDNWKIPAQAEIQATGLQPKHDLESALVRTLAPGSYTAIVRGTNGTGVGTVQVYDLAQASNSKLANISSRGSVQPGDDKAMIAGFIIGGSGRANPRVVVRALGPSLSAFGIAQALPDPTLELKNANGSTLLSNDEWQQSQQKAEISNRGLAPGNTHESALAISLPNGGYTAIVRGKGTASGVAVVEVYNVE